jgi:hypothetical protein
MKTTKIGAPVSYKNCFIVPVNDGFDVVDKTSGRWMHIASQRMAKWNATVWTRLSSEFSVSPPVRKTKLTWLQTIAAVIDKPFKEKK